MLDSLMLSGMAAGEIKCSADDLAKEQAVHFTLANLYVFMDHWRLALSVLTKARGLLYQERDMARGVENVQLLNLRCSWLDYCIGCVFLQLGCTSEAEHAFCCVSKWMLLANTPVVHSQQTNFGTHMRHSCRCLVMFAKGAYSKVMCSLERITNVASDSMEQKLAPYHAHVASELINNRAICALYLCDLEWAIASLEDAIWKDPSLHFREVTVFNLCTLYDLSSNSKTAAMRKKQLQKLALQHNIGDIDASLFRIASHE